MSDAYFGTASLRFSLYEWQEDPYPTYQLLRDGWPVYRSWRRTQAGPRAVWGVSRFADIQSVARDHQTFSSVAPSIYGNAPDLVESDPPLHDEVRGLFHARFARNALVDTMAEFIREETAKVVRSIRARQTVDLAAEFAWLLPAIVTCRLLGYPASDAARLRDLKIDEAKNFWPSFPDETVESRRVQVEEADYVKSALGARRALPGEDLLTLLAVGEIGSGPLSQPLLEGTAILIHRAMIDTTASLLVHALCLLAEHPDQRAWLRDHPEGWPDAIEEVLRFESPIQSIDHRRATRDVQIADTVIPAGDGVALMYGSGNRDDRQFDDPDRFDIRRKAGRNLSFGEGVHFCLGAHLARLEASIALPMLLAELGDYEVVAKPARVQSFLLRSIWRLEVAPAWARASGPNFA